MSGSVDSFKSARALFRTCLVLLPFAAWLAWHLTPWYSAAPILVELRLEAPKTSVMKLSWDGNAANAVPFIPILEPNESTARLWVAEIPPRPTYRLSLSFESPVERAALDELVLVNVIDFHNPLLRMRAKQMAERLVPDGCRLSSSNDNVSLDCPSTGTLSLPLPIDCSSVRGAERFLKVWGILWGSLSLIILIAFTFLRESCSSHTLADGAHPARIPRESLVPIAIACGASLAIHMAVVANLPSIYDRYDPLGYFQKAVWLVEKGTYVSNEPCFEIDRLPGYPFFLATCITVFGYSLKAVSLTQALLYAASLSALAVALRHWISPRFSAVGVAVALLSPAGILNMLAIGTEGLFAPLSVLAMAAFFEHLGVRGRASAIWMGTCGVAICAATMVRPNGIVLLAAPASVYLPAVIRAVLMQACWIDRLKSVVGCTLRYATPVALVTVALSIWAVRNARQHTFFAPTSMVGVSLVEGLMVSRTFDARSLKEEGLYEHCLREEYRHQYLYNGWGVKVALFDKLTSNETSVPSDIITDLDRRLKNIAARSESLSPWELKAAGWLRSIKKSWDCPAPRYLGNDEIHTSAWQQFC